jgi:hypothetical protein
MPWPGLPIFNVGGAFDVAAADAALEDLHNRVSGVALPLEIAQVVLTGSRTMATSDLDKLLIYDGTSDITLTISTALNTGATARMILVAQMNTGKVTVVTSGLGPPARLPTTITAFETTGPATFLRLLLLGANAGLMRGDA